MSSIIQHEPSPAEDEISGEIEFRSIAPRFLGLIGQLFALKAGFALATLVAIAAGSRWGWIIPEGTVEPRFLLSGLVTVVLFCACAVLVPRGSKMFYLFGIVLNVTSFAVAIIRGSLGLVGIVALIMSTVMLVVMALPDSWRGALRGASVELRPPAIVGAFLLGALLLVPAFIVGGAEGADRDGFVHGPLPESVEVSEMDDFLDATGANRGCLMGKLYFEFGADTLSTWDVDGPSEAQMTVIEQLAESCK